MFVLRLRVLRQEGESFVRERPVAVGILTVSKATKVYGTGG